MPENDPKYASRGGLKLHHALREFKLDPTGWVCADLGCSTGGFTDCLLRHGAEHIYAVDTAYGELAWPLRQDPRVTVLERSNALHIKPLKPCDLVVVDLGWTPQHRAIPAAAHWLKTPQQGGPGRVISLIKPHYEASASAMAHGRKGKLDDAEAGRITDRVVEELNGSGYRVHGLTPSPIRGGKGGNLEYLVLLTAVSDQA